MSNLGVIATSTPTIWALTHFPSRIGKYESWTPTCLSFRQRCYRSCSYSIYFLPIPFSSRNDTLTGLSLLSCQSKPTSWESMPFLTTIWQSSDQQGTNSHHTTTVCSSVMCSPIVCW